MCLLTLVLSLTERNSCYPMQVMARRGGGIDCCITAWLIYSCTYSKSMHWGIPFMWGNRILSYTLRILSIELYVMQNPRMITMVTRLVSQLDLPTLWDPGSNRTRMIGSPRSNDPRFCGPFPERMDLNSNRGLHTTPRPQSPTQPIKVPFNCVGVSVRNG